MPLIAVVWQPGAAAPGSVLLCTPARAVPSPACPQPSSPALLGPAGDRSVATGSVAFSREKAVPIHGSSPGGLGNHRD